MFRVWSVAVEALGLMPFMQGEWWNPSEIIAMTCREFELTFDVPAVPVAQPRQKHAMIGGHLRNYTPTKHPVNAFKASCRTAASAVYDGPPLRVALRLTLTFLLPRPIAMFWKKKDMPRVPHTKKPDIDNLSKSVKDALSNLVWHDDSLISHLNATKFIASGYEQPHVRVKVEVI